MSSYEFGANQIPLDDELPPDESHPVTHDLDVDVNLATFPTPASMRPDGFINPGESELSIARDGIEELKWQNVINSSRLRDATPSPVFTTRGGVEQ